MFKKILAVVFSLLMLSALGLPAMADGVEILSPANGAIVSADFSLIEATVPEGAEAIIYLDGERLFTTSEENISYTLQNPLAIGTHKVVVVAVLNSQVLKSESLFKVEGKLQKEHVSLNMSAAPDIPDFYYIAQSVTDMEGESYEIQIKKTVGREGNDDSAISFTCPVDIPAQSGNVCPYYAGGSSLGYPWTGIVNFQIDMYFSHPTAFGFETKNANNQFGNIFSEILFNTDGTVAQSGGKRYPIGEWFKVRIIIDIRTLEASLDIGTFGEDGDVTWENVIAGFRHSATIRNVNTFKIQPNFRNASVAGQTIAFDNIVVTEEKAISSDVPMYFKKGNETTSVTDGVFVSDTNKLLIEVGDMFSFYDVTDLISVFAEGVACPVESAVIDEDGLAVVLACDFEAGMQYSILLSKELLLSNNTSVGADILYGFKTGYNDALINLISFEIDDKPLYSAVQIKGNSTLSAKITHSSACNVFLGVYEGAKLIALTCQPIATDDPLMVPVTLTLPDGYEATENTVVKLFSTVSLSERIPASAVWCVN